MTEILSDFQEPSANHSKLRRIALAFAKLVQGKLEGLPGVTRNPDYSPQWADDRLGYWPIEDRGGAMSTYDGSGDGGMLGVHARVELNEEDGRPLMDGLPPDALQPK